MRWHESKFSKTIAAAVVPLLAGILLRLGSGPAPISAAPADSLRQIRADSFKEIGLHPWYDRDGVFISMSDDGSTIYEWTLGNDWDTAIGFKVISTRVFAAK